MTNEEIIISVYGTDIEGIFNHADMEAMNLMLDAAREDEAGKYLTQLKEEMERSKKLLEALEKEVKGKLQLDAMICNWNHRELQDAEKKEWERFQKENKSLF